MGSDAQLAKGDPVSGLRSELLSIRGRSRNFGKGGVVRGQSPKPSAEGGLGASPRKFRKIRCDFLKFGIYFWDQNGLGYHSKLGLC